MSLNLACFWQSPGPYGATWPTKAPEGLAWVEGQPPAGQPEQSSATHSSGLYRTKP